MRTYSSFKPTQYDHHIVIKTDDGTSREDWLKLSCSRNRDSGCLQESNFHSALQQLGGESEDVEVHRFGHWGNGWFETILIKPNTPAAAEAEKIEDSLADYPILDESDLSEREQEAADQTWKNCYKDAERLSYIREHRSQFDFHNLTDLVACVRGRYFLGYANELLSG